MARIALPITIAVALIAAACGGGGGGAGAPDTGGAPPSQGAPIPGGGLSIQEAIDSTLAGPLAVRGFIVAPEGERVRLCTALLESYPPQCGEPSLVVEGLELATIEGLESTDDPSLAQVTWSDAEVSLLGTVEDGVLTVSATSV
jgi:hypothetical protein